MEKRKKGEEDMSDDIITQLKQWTALSFKQKKKSSRRAFIVREEPQGLFW